MSKHIDQLLAEVREVMAAYELTRLDEVADVNPVLMRRIHRLPVLQLLSLENKLSARY